MWSNSGDSVAVTLAIKVGPGKHVEIYTLDNFAIN